MMCLDIPDFTFKKETFSPAVSDRTLRVNENMQKIGKFGKQKAKLNILSLETPVQTSLFPTFISVRAMLKKDFQNLSQI